MKISKTKHTARPLPLILALAALCLALTCCGGKEDLSEGECKCTVSFSDIPRELSLMEENLQKNFYIQVTLFHLTTEKEYEIRLDAENGFTREVSLHPGVYRILDVYSPYSYNTGISLSAKTESVELSPDREARVEVYVDNPDEFSRHWMNVQPMPEMLLADKFDGLIQINRQIFDLHDRDVSPLLAQLDVSYEGQVPPYESVTVYDPDMGVHLTLLNPDGQPADLTACRLIGIRVSRNNVVFPQGVTLGMSTQAVCHGGDGLYGEPDAFTGDLFYSLGLNPPQAIYRNPSTGEKLTLTLQSSGLSIQSIEYELEQFE